MSPRISIRSLPRSTSLGVLALLFASAPAVAAAATVSRCTQPSGAVLYADCPCPGGDVVDIRPGSPAHDATERLERARDELDRAAARREANEHAAALRREQLYQSYRLAEMHPVAPADLGYEGTYGYHAPYVYGRTHRPNDVHRRADNHRRSHQGRVPAVIRRPHSGG